MHPPALILPMVASAMAGCAAPSYFASRPPAAHVIPEAASKTDWSSPDPRGLPMFASESGRGLTWAALLDAAGWAEVVFVGEQHDDAVGHRVEQAIVGDALDRFPGAALSMEMLERHEQPIVDDYLDGVIEPEPFVRMTNSANWGGEGMWEEWYQPMIDSAKARGARVIAANAPRRYVRLARTLGYPRLRELARQTPGQSGLFDTPDRLPRGGYRRRFWEIMSEGHAGAGAAAGSAPRPPESPRDREARLVAGFRAQLVWDTTMAASIDQALRTGAKKVIHIVGQFHTDAEGGTVQELRRRRPDSRILIISLQRTSAAAVRAEDRGIADIVIHTGEPPADPEPSPLP
jgi:uncharacterized iron-regulated protein